MTRIRECGSHEKCQLVSWQMKHKHPLTFKMSAELLHRSTEPRLHWLRQFTDACHLWRPVRRWRHGRTKHRWQVARCTGKCCVWNTRRSLGPGVAEWSRCGWKKCRDIHRTCDMTCSTENKKYNRKVSEFVTVFNQLMNVSHFAAHRCRNQIVFSSRSKLVIMYWIGLSSVLRPRQHNIGYMGDPSLQ